MSDGIEMVQVLLGLPEMVQVLLGLPEMKVVGVVDGNDELVVTVETTVTVASCPWRGERARAQDRSPTSVRDRPCFGRPVWPDVIRRRWRCPHADCPQKTWTEHIDALDATAVLTRRAGVRRRAVKAANTPVEFPPYDGRVGVG